MDLNYHYDTNHVRYELVSSHEGKQYNWLFFPGGPGLDSRYLHSLVDLLELPGNVWLVDFPGNGDNLVEEDYDYNKWLGLFIPAILKFENPIAVGHSFGGMLPLLYPELETHLSGLVILNSTPSLWLEEAVNYSRQFDLPDLSADMADFVTNPSQLTFQKALDACTPYYFHPSFMEGGKAVFKDIPFPYKAAVWGQKIMAELNYSAKWAPQNVPTLIMGGTYDCITPFTLFQKNLAFHRPNIEMVLIEKGGHFPWIEDPESVKEAFSSFVKTLN